MSKAEAYALFLQELDKFKEDIIRAGGLFFNFVSDPCIPETMELNFRCIERCVYNGVPVVLLTKNADWHRDILWNELLYSFYKSNNKTFIKFGFTLTGCDELEPGASPNLDRIIAMYNLHKLGYYTWASIEPIIDPMKSYEMFKKALPFCEEFRFGLNSLKKNYTKEEIS